MTAVLCTRVHSRGLAKVRFENLICSSYFHLVVGHAPHVSAASIRSLLLAQAVDIAVARFTIPISKSEPGLTELYSKGTRASKRTKEANAGATTGWYLQHGAALLRLTNSKMLEVALERIIKELAANQTENGYLGVWLPGHVFKQNAPKCPC
eukprot:gene10861-8479_t